MLRIRSYGTLFAFIWIPPPPPPLVRLQPISPWTPALLAPFLCPFRHPRWRFSVQIQRSLVPNTLHCRLPQYRFHTHCQLKSWMETTLNSINNFKWNLRYTALRTDFIWIVRRIHPLKPCIKIHILSSHWFQCQYLIVVLENLYYHNLLGHEKMVKFRSQGLSSSCPLGREKGGKRRDPGNEVVDGTQENLKVL